ncbi:hypothetical protein CYY_007735 [Polysphondylium violaceum]|uniref:SD-repeat containing protein B domain-containing protein n=1 Tax=Polysphondylium violaceum TaxID=133409 RepID=A0A8J4PP85_9MYCE|nr:hypothetical protein CYY_007735 [Polysphondylium violaceum]
MVKLLTLISLTVVLLSFYNSVHCRRLDSTNPVYYWGFRSPADFNKIFSQANNEGFIVWNGTNTKINIGQPIDQNITTQILGTNVPTNTSYFNHVDLLNFFGNSSYATMVAHFNCKDSDQTCQEFRFNESMPDFCLMFGSVDGYDQVSIDTHDKTLGYQTPSVSWTDIKNGSFSNLTQQCHPIEKSETSVGTTTLGCFDKTCDNPNFIILRPNDTLSYLKICFNSFSESEVIFYSFARCDLLGGIVTRRPLFAAFTVLGSVFLDIDGDGIFDPSKDVPIPGILVYLTTSSGGPVRDSTGVIPPVETDSDGDFALENIPRGAYRIRFDIDNTAYSATGKSNDITTEGTSKVNPNFSTDILILANSGRGIRDSTEEDNVNTEKVLPNINAGLVLI